MKLSIRYDLIFQESLLRYTDDQVDLAVGQVSASGGDNEAPSLRQEQRANASFMHLCDSIDAYVENRLRHVRQEIAKAVDKAN